MICKESDMETDMVTSGQKSHLPEGCMGDGISH